MIKKFLFLFLFPFSTLNAQIITDSAFVHHQILTGIDTASYIFEGEVLSTESYHSPSQDFIYTSNTVRVNQSWKPNDQKPLRKDELVEVITRGGSVGDESVWISHQIGFFPGQKGMFLCNFASFPPNPNSSIPSAKKLQLFDGLYVDYDFTKHYINASYSRFNFECIDLFYKMIDSTHVVECLDVYPNGILQYQKYSQLEALCTSKAQTASSGNETITYTFENASTTVDGSTFIYEFDIYVQSTAPVYFDTGNAIITYNSDAFGTNVVASNQVVVQRGEVIAALNDYFDPMPIDLAPNTISVVASATESPANRFQIGPNAEQLLHVKIEIQDCSELPDLSFDLLGDMLNFSFYAETATGPNFNFNNITASDTENGSMCGMSISSFSPQVVNGGVGDVVTINGINFGNTEGTVQMKNADDGGETWVDLDDYDILSWANNQIQVRVPSILPLEATNENQLKVPGSGKIKVITADGDNDETNSELIINYSWRNYNAPASNLKSQAVLAGRDPVFDEDDQNQEPGYRFIPHPNVANNSDAMQSIATAMRQWTCETGIRWELATDETTTATSIEDDISTIRFGSTNVSTNLGETSVRDFRCQPPPEIDDLGFAREIDIVISDASNHPFFYDDTGLENQPADFYDFHSVVLHELGHAHLLKHINQPEDLMFWELLPNDAEIANFNRKISLSTSNIDGGTDIMNHSTGIDFGLCNENDDAIVELQLTNCNFAMDVSDERVRNNQLSIFPNPSTGVFSIQYKQIQSETAHLYIYNTVGEKVRHIVNWPDKSNSGIYQIDLSHLAPGLYIAEIRSEKFQRTKRFIIQ